MTSSQLSDQSMYSRGQVLTRDFNTLRSLIVLKYLRYLPVLVLVVRYASTALVSSSCTATRPVVALRRPPSLALTPRLLSPSACRDREVETRL